MEHKSKSDSVENEMKKWLQVALAKENLKNLTVDVGGNSEKGDGYIGEINFIVASGTDESGKTRNYNLVLKCSKPSRALMAAFPIREAFMRESYFYEEIFPVFRNFQIARGVQKPFDSVSKCYGTYSDGFRYVIALENLKKIGYEQWNNGTPLTRRHIDLIVAEYAKFHAVSVAMKELEPDKFHKLINGIEDDIFRKIVQCAGIVTAYEKGIEEIAELLKNDLSEIILRKWLSFKNQISYVFSEMTPDNDDLRVITHADCWNNNFLHKYANDDKSVPSQVAILDWQICRYMSPVFDLSYFLFSCISEEDMTDMETILRMYYQTFSDYVTKLGSTFMERYPVENLLREWKKYSKFGLASCLLPVKSAYSSKEDLPDMAKSAESGEDFGNTFVFELTDTIGCRNRLRPLVKYGVEFGLI